MNKRVLETQRPFIHLLYILSCPYTIYLSMQYISDFTK